MARCSAAGCSITNSLRVAWWSAAAGWVTVVGTAAAPIGLQPSRAMARRAVGCRNGRPAGAAPLAVASQITSQSVTGHHTDGTSCARRSQSIPWLKCSECSMKGCLRPSRGPHECCFCSTPAGGRRKQSRPRQAGLSHRPSWRTPPPPHTHTPTTVSLRAMQTTSTSHCTQKQHEAAHVRRRKWRRKTWEQPGPLVDPHATPSQRSRLPGGEQGSGVDIHSRNRWRTRNEEQRQPVDAQDEGAPAQAWGQRAQ